MTTALDTRRYRLGLDLFARTARWLRWYVLGMIVLVPILSVVFADAIETGLWTITTSVFQWFVAVAAGGWLAANLAATLARGVTRRELIAAYLVFGALASITAAAIALAGFAAEHALLTLAAEPFGTWNEALSSGARYLLVTPIYFFTGTFIGAGAVRFGHKGWFIAAVIVGGTAHYAGVLALEFGDFVAAGRVLAWAATALGATALLVTASVLALRNIPIGAKRA